VFSAFYFWVDTGRSGICIKTSGHWFFYVITTIAFAFTLAHFYTHSVYHVITRWFTGYAIIYQVLTLRVLVTTQRYYHDPLEALHAMKLALMIVPVLVLTGFMVLGTEGLTSFWVTSSSPAPSVSSHISSSPSNPETYQPVSRPASIRPSSPPPLSEDVPPAPELSPEDNSSSGGSNAFFEELKNRKLKPVPKSAPKPKDGGGGGGGDLMAAMKAKLAERRPQVKDDWETD